MTRYSHLTARPLPLLRNLSVYLITNATGHRGRLREKQEGISGRGKRNSSFFDTIRISSKFLIAREARALLIEMLVIGKLVNSD